MATTGCDDSLRTTALFELGGTRKTIEAIEGDYQFIEPLYSVRIFSKRMALSWPSKLCESYALQRFGSTEELFEIVSDDSVT